MFGRLLLALDAGDAGAVAVSFTVALAKRCGAHVDVVHVHERVLGSGLADARADEAAELVTAALKELHAAHVDATGLTYRTSRFDVAGAICDLAQECGSDAIVLGSRRRRRLRPGPVRARVARRTPLPVLTAPAPLRVPRRERALAEAPSPTDLRVTS